MLLKELELDLSMLDQELAWYSIMLEPIALRKMYRNPTRPDNTPGCKFFLNPDGHLFLKDFSTDETFSCVSAYSKIHHIPYNRALKELYHNVCRTTPIQTIKLDRLKPSNVGIDIVEREFTKEEIAYWSRLGLSVEDLVVDQFSVKALESYTFTYSSEEKKGSRKCYPSDMAFAYCGDYSGVKLYFPERNKHSGRFRNSLKDNEVFFKVRSLDNIIVTKSHKDFLILNKMIKESGLPWSVTHVQSENTIPLRDEFNFNGNVVTLLDNDAAGIKASEKFKEKYPYALIEYIPKEKGKDLSDYITNYSYKEAYKFINSLLIKHYVI